MRRVRTTEKEEEVKQVITANPRLSVRKIARMSNMSTGTGHATLRSLKLYPYGISMRQELKLPDTCTAPRKFLSVVQPLHAARNGCFRPHVFS